jgi:uncharacterized protein DUF1416
MGCGAPDQDKPLAGAHAGETVIEGTVVRGGAPVSKAYVRLLDGSGEFTAEVASGTAGNFRFFAAPGDWTLRVLSPSGNGEQAVTAAQGVNEVTLEVA